MQVDRVDIGRIPATGDCPCGHFILSWGSDKGFGEFAFWQDADGSLHIDTETLPLEDVRDVLEYILREAIIERRT